MPLIDVSGVQVNFPFTPYSCQVDYMSKVLTCLQKNQNGVLESPTGTGKTLSLLCSTLAWQESRKAQVELTKQASLSDVVLSSANETENVNLVALKNSLQVATGGSWGSDEFFVPKIIYASRTHSQLTQAVQELKRTAYNSVKSSVIGSREQLCIHQQVQKLTNNFAKVNLCRAKVAARHCHFYNNIEEFKKKGDARKIIGNVVDIEDIVQIGHKTKTCPYYMARELKADADIVFMPYNYLLDSKSRKAHGVDLQGSVIIFDEAHNLEKICEESASFDLSSLDLATAIEETTKLAEKLAELCVNEAEFSQVEDSLIVPEFSFEDTIRLKQTLLLLEEKLDEIEIHNYEEGKSLPGSFIFDFLAKVNITWTTKNDLLGILDKMGTYLSNDAGSSILNTKGAGLTKFADCLKIVFSQEPRELVSLPTHQRLLSEYFKVYIQTKDKESRHKTKIDSWSTSGNADKKERILSYWCFSPGHTMKDLLAHGVKVIILTSGTLSPLDSFAVEMQIPFPVKLENPHVIEKNQVWLGTLCKGPDGAVLNSEYKNRSNEAYQKSLGNTIMNFARIVPNGLLVFFPSYPLMEQCIEKWKITKQWDSITNLKPVIVEPKGKALFNEAMDEYYTKVSDPNLSGAIFMAVCRGKVSEGLDFADAYGRAVMITGLPFPPRFDPRVKLKMDFLKENKHKFKGLSDNTWYRQQATRAVNQAIGRVIRHNKDYGAIVLCDTRFSSLDNKNALPLWVRDQSQVYTNFGLALREVISFFKEAETNFPAADPKQLNSSKKHSVVSGACFEPSITRRAQSQSHVTIEYEPASSVVCHIPSLRNSTDEDGAAFYKQYAKPKSPGKAKKRSILEALESAEDHSDNTPDGKTKKCDLQFQITSFQPPMKKLPGKQKKIKLKETSLTEIIYSNSPTEDKTKVETATKKLVHETSKNYIKEVKEALTSETYNRFTQMLNKYFKERQIHDVIPVLADLFTSSPDNYHLFKKFFRFVLLKDKLYYARTCYELTGLSCDYKPSESQKVKQLDLKSASPSGRTHGSNAAKTSVISGVMVTSTVPSTSNIVPSTSSTVPSTRFTVPSTSSTVPSTSGIVPSTSGTVPSTNGIVPSTSSVCMPASSCDKKEFRGYLPHYKDKVTISSLTMRDDGKVMVMSRDVRQETDAHGSFIWSSDRKTAKHFRHDDSKIYSELVAKGVIDPKDNLFTPDMFIYPSTWEEAQTGKKEFVRFPTGETIFSTCVLCDKLPVNGFQHECGAICCFQCWKEQVFEKSKERICPYPHCCKRVQRKHLKPIKDNSTH